MRLNKLVESKSTISVLVDGHRLSFVRGKYGLGLNDVVSRTIASPVIRIPDEVDGEPVTEIMAWCFYETATEATGIFVPDSVQCIHPKAFVDTTIRQVSGMVGVLEIGDDAFNTRQLINVAMPRSITKIGHWAFRGALLGDVVIPASVVKIDAGAFLSSHMETLSFEEGSKLETIGDRAFLSCVWLKSIAPFPRSLKLIDEYAFYRTIRLNSPVVLPPYVKVGHNAFDQGVDVRRKVGLAR